MALGKDLVERIERDVAGVYLNGVQGLSMLEFGDQIIKYTQQSGKLYWQGRGFAHTSVDINAQRGSIPKDLSVFADFEAWHNTFDVVYNAGTTEHVEPYDAQYTSFRIADHCVKPGGVMIHAVPCVERLDTLGIFREHCHYYYSHAFFDTLINKSGYQLIDRGYTQQNLLYYAFRKTHNSVFMDNRDLFLANIAVRHTSPKGALSLRIARLQDNNYLYQESAERLEAKRLKEQANQLAERNRKRVKNPQTTMIVENNRQRLKSN
jgi:hypothetical protein|tara:strand:- start:136 stop:927 length:792 start_codon:yes stop_codon:yes gene_type:complete